MTDGFRLADGVGWADFDDSVVVVADRTRVSFSQSPELIRRLFDGLARGATVDELEPDLPGIDVVDLLDRLRGAGVVDGGPAPVLDPGFAPGYRPAPSADGPLRVGIMGDAATLGCLERAVTSASEVVTPLDEAEITLIAASSPAALASWSAECWSSGRTHIPLSAYDGRAVLIGPFALPRLTACFDCLVLRRSGATTWSDHYWSLMHSEELRTPWTEEQLRFAAVTATRIARNSARDGDQRPIGRVSVWDPRLMSISSYRLWSVPRCPTCSPLETYSTSYPWREATPAEKDYWDRSSVS